MDRLGQMRLTDLRRRLTLTSAPPPNRDLLAPTCNFFFFGFFCEYFIDLGKRNKRFSTPFFYSSTSQLQFQFPGNSSSSVTFCRVMLLAHLP